MRIWKWPLQVTDVQTCLLPKGAVILDAQMQGETLCLWALCDEGQTKKEKRGFAIYGTGNPIPYVVGKYISTFQMQNGKLVFHVFEVDLS